MSPSQTAFNPSTSPTSEKIIGAGVAGRVRPCAYLPSSDLRSVKPIVKCGIWRQDWLWRKVAFTEAFNHLDIVSLVDTDADVFHIVTKLYYGGGMFNKIVEKLWQGRSNKSLGGMALTCLCEDDAARILCAMLLVVAYLHARM
jgi:hypothetical protein